MGNCNTVPGVLGIVIVTPKSAFVVAANEPPDHVTVLAFGSTACDHPFWAVATGSMTPFGSLTTTLMVGELPHPCSMAKRISWRLPALAVLLLGLACAKATDGTSAEPVNPAKTAIAPTANFGDLIPISRVDDRVSSGLTETRPCRSPRSALQVGLDGLPRGQHLRGFSALFAVPVRPLASLRPHRSVPGSGFES